MVNLSAKKKDDEICATSLIKTLAYRMHFLDLPALIECEVNEGKLLRKIHSQSYDEESQKWIIK